MDFRIVATVSFQLLDVWFLIDHGRRRLIHFKVTTNPNSRWVIQQLRALPRRLHSSLPPPRPRLDLLSEGRGCDPELWDPSVRRSPWQNAIAERWVGTCRRELLDHVIVFGEGHLRRLLADCVAYYNAERVHRGLGDSPDGRSIEPDPPLLPGSSLCRVSAVFTTGTSGRRRRKTPSGSFQDVRTDQPTGFDNRQDVVRNPWHTRAKHKWMTLDRRPGSKAGASDQEAGWKTRSG